MKRPVVITLLIVALALVCLGIGAVAFFAVNGGFPANSPFDINNISSVVEESKTIKVDTEKPLTLIVADDSGDITVTGADVDTVQVKVIKTAYDSTQARADEEVKAIQYTVEQVGDTITLKYELPKSMNFNNKINTVDFIVTVPTETTVNADTGFGTVAVTDLKGNVDINGDFGNVTVENVEGALAVESSSGRINAMAVNAGSNNVTIKADFGNIELEKIKGKDVNITSNSGTITLTDVRATGDVFIKTDFGNTIYENGSAASLTLDTNSGKTSVTKVNIAKELNIQNDFGDIDLNQAMAGTYDLHTNSGSITINGAKGNLKASTDFGNIEISNAKSVTLDVKTNSGTIDFSGSLGTGPHNVKSDFGDITLSLPADSKLNVDLKTDFGKITSNIPLTVTLDGNSEKNRQIGTMNGGGEQLTVSANSGGINITAIK
ncbi:MAG: DUF4097 family beta strand repeat protein [Anaerolineales bacterium]|nr:DUF4097 family beta strand repeat protein [Anaerolineales bacterium]